MTDAPKAKIYTRTGDKGQTHLVDGSRVAKSDLRVDSYGTVDELNSAIGLVRTEMSTAVSGLDAILEVIQNQLFNIGSLLATEKEDVLKMLPPVTPEQVRELEKHIDLMTQELPELKNFILPGGSKVSAFLHLARTICRRAERRVSELVLADPRDEISMIYLNRLSDFLFVASRWCNFKLGLSEVVWKKS